MYGMDINNGVNNVTGTNYTSYTSGVNKTTGPDLISFKTNPTENKSFYPGLDLNPATSVEVYITKMPEMDMLREVCGI